MKLRSSLLMLMTGLVLLAAPALVRAGDQSRDPRSLLIHPTDGLWQEQAPAPAQPSSTST